MAHCHKQLNQQEIAEWELMGPLNFHAANLNRWSEYMFEWHRFIPDSIQPSPEQPTAEQVADEQPVTAYPTAYPMPYVPGVASTFAMRRTVSGTECCSPPPAARTPSHQK